MSMLPPVFVELRANIGEFKTKMGEAKTEIAVLEKEGSSKFSKVAAAGKGALLGLTAVAVGVGIASVKMADEFEVSHAKLETSLKNAGASYETYKDQIAKVSKEQEAFGYTNAQTEEAIANLTTALGSPKKALADMGLAADVAKFKHIGLAEAATLVAKASEGNLKPLKAMGIDLPIVAGGAQALMRAHTQLSTATQKLSTFMNSHADAANKSSKSHGIYLQMLDKVKIAQDKVNQVSHSGTDILKALSDKVGGTAANASKTLGGQVGALKAQTEDLFKNIGIKLIPILQKLVHWIVQSIKWFGEHKTAAKVFGTFIGVVLVGLIGAYISTLIKAGYAQLKTFATDIAKGVVWVATKIAQYAMVAGAAVVSAATTAIAWIAANAAMILATGGIILAIGLLVAAVLYLKNHWREVLEKIKAFLHAAVDWIKAKFKALIDFFHNIWNTLVGIVKKVFEFVGKVISTYINIWKGIFKAVGDAFSAIWNGLSGAVKAAFDFVGGIIKGYINIWIGLINFIIRAIDKIKFKIPDYVPVVGGKEFGIHLPEIPALATGGVVNRPTVALIGEAGPEAIVPLSKFNAMGNGNQSINVVVNVSGSVIHERDLAVTVRDHIAQLMRRRGLDPAILGV